MERDGIAEEQCSRIGAYRYVGYRNAGSADGCPKGVSSVFGRTVMWFHKGKDWEFETQMRVENNQVKGA